MPNVLMFMVQEFHAKMKLTIGDPRDPNVSVDQDLRFRLIKEEFEELIEALATVPESASQAQIIEVADALGDIVYTCFGAAVSWGIDLASVMDAIHTSNMTKTASHKSAGKVMKGPNYEPPKIAEALAQAANDFNSLDPDSWWPKPYFEEPPEVSRELKTMAAMATIKSDFVPALETQLAHSKPTRNGSLPSAEELAQEELDFDLDLIKHAKDAHLATQPWDIDKISIQEYQDKSIREAKSYTPSEATLKPFRANAYNGQMTTYGAFVFDCSGCGRTHAVQARLGSRGGVADKATCECMCGKAFQVEFFPDIKVTETTIEALR